MGEMKGKNKNWKSKQTLLAKISCCFCICQRVKNEFILWDFIQDPWYFYYFGEHLIKFYFCYAFVSK